MTQQDTRDWRVASASVQGSGHERAGMPCQDAHCWSVRQPDGVLVAAVADGAGSASLAEVGANIAAHAAVDALAGGPCARGSWAERLRAALGAALTAVEAEAAERGATPRELATTLIVVLAGESEVAVAQIGDGAVVIGDTDRNFTSLTVPRSGEYINETTFLVSPGAVDQAQFAAWHGAPAFIAVFSDGLQRLALKAPENTPHAGFFQPLFNFAATAADADSANDQLRTFLRSPRVSSRADDDLTLVLACYG